MKSLFARWALPALAAAISFNSAAADYPAKPVTLVIGFTAGGPTDAVGRYLARKLETELGQTVVVENRAGANGVVAVQSVKRAAADGYTLMLGSSGTLSIEPVYKQKVDYQVLKDFQPVALVDVAAPDEAGEALLAHAGAGQHRSAEGIRAVEHRERQAETGRTAHRVVHRPDVGVEPHTDVLHVERERVDPGILDHPIQLLSLREVRIAERQAGALVALDHAALPGLHGTVETVLGSEEVVQRYPACDQGVDVA